MSDASSLFRRWKPRGEGETPPPPPFTDKAFSINPYRDEALRGTPDPRLAKQASIQVPTRRASDHAPTPSSIFVPPVAAALSAAIAARPDESRLTVGRNIRLKGEISACDVLVVEGEVEASVKCRLLEVAKGGVFRGQADVETAEIHGHFDGQLTTAKVLKVMGGGRVEGRIRYAMIEVASGGQLGGDIGMVSAETARSQFTTVPNTAMAGAALSGAALSGAALSGAAMAGAAMAGAVDLNAAVNHNPLRQS